MREIAIERMKPVNFEALRAELREHMRDGLKSLAVRNGIVYVGVEEMVTDEGEQFVRDLVMTHDANKLTTEQVARLEMHRGLIKVREALKENPDDQQTRVEWLMLEVMRLVDLSGPD